MLEIGRVLYSSENFQKLLFKTVVFKEKTVEKQIKIGIFYLCVALYENNNNIIINLHTFWHPPQHKTTGRTKKLFYVDVHLVLREKKNIFTIYTILRSHYGIENKKTNKS